MLKKSITFENFDEQTVTQDFYFHLSKAQIIKMNVAKEDGMEVYIQRLIDAKDGETIMNELTNLIRITVGKKSEDGNRFIHNDEITSQFMDSPAFDVLLLELFNLEKAAEFINAVAPKGFKEDVEKLVAEQEKQEAKAKGEPQVSEEIKKGVAERNQPATVEEDSITRKVLEVQKEQRRAGHPEADPTATDAPLVRVTLETATKENPYRLTQAEMVEMDGEQLKAGLAEGLYVL